MQKLKQGTAAVALVTSLGLVMPALFGGPASADVSHAVRSLQEMTVSCEALGETVYDVVAIDKDPGDNMATMQDTDSNLVFVPRKGTVTTIYTAIDPTNPEAVIALPPGSLDPYPTSFVIPPEHDFAYLGGEFSRGRTKARNNLIACIVIDDSPENYFEAGAFDAEQEDCLVDGVKIEEPTCFAEGVTYHYKDVYAIKALVTGNSGARA